MDDITADLIKIAKIDAVPSVLRIVCEMTGLRFAAVARVTGTHWAALAVRDEIAFGLKAGDELDLQSTICDEIRCSGTGVVIDHVAEHPVYRDHHTPKLYGFQSYISMPIHSADGRFFGTLCALDPEPAQLSDPGITASFRNFAQLIGYQIDAQDRLAEAEAAIADADRTAVLREQFIAILGHDLRNPVAAIHAGTTLLEKGDLDARSRNILARMKESGQRITGLIDGLLDFARGRLGAGLILNRQITGTLAATIEQVVAEIRMVHPAREIDVQITLGDAVTCDEDRIAQLASNLLANALTHGDPGKPVRVVAQSGDGRFALSVENHGPPIPPAALQGLFQPFTQGPGGKSAAGLGLGLFICSEIAKAHGGSLSATSNVHATRFTLEMPATHD